MIGELGSSGSNINFSKSAELVKPIFSDWVHNCVSLLKPPDDYPPKQIIFPSLSNTSQGVIVICIPDLLLPNSQNSLSSSVFCWTPISKESTSNPQQEIAKAIVSQYQHSMPKLAIAARVNPTSSDLKSSVQKIKQKPSGNRILFHYMSYGGPSITDDSITLYSPDRMSHEKFPIESIMAAVHPCSVHIYDCDNAGALMSKYQACLAKSDSPCDVFAFFSCEKDQKLPRPPGFPFDLFTSCMTTPAHAALLWHSRHYYCFKYGPLKPLDVSFYHRIPPNITEEICIIIHRLVEAMAFEVFEKELFLTVFRTDPAIAHFVSNFYLAVRIMSYFNVQPQSLPEIPSLLNHPLWHTLDLRLDIALQQYSLMTFDQSLSYHSYLKQSLDTLEHLMLVTKRDLSFPSQLSLIPPALTSQDLRDDACRILAKYIDRSLESISQIWYFPVVVPLFQLLKFQTKNMYLYFCIAKILCYMPSSRMIISDLFSNPIHDLFFPQLTSKETLFPLIILCILSRNNEAIINQILGEDWCSIIGPLLSSENPDVRLFALMFLSTFLSHIKEVDKIKKIFIDFSHCINDPVPIVRVATLHSLSQVSVNEVSDLIKQFFEKAVIDINTTVRTQLLISYYSKNIHDSKDTFLSESLECDPFFIRNSLIAQIQSAKMESSYLFDYLCHFVLKGIHSVVENPSITLYEASLESESLRVQPKSTTTIQKLRPTSSICFSNKITSNVSISPRDFLVVGDEKGLIYYTDWDYTNQKSIQISNNSISQVANIWNNGNPLTIISDFSGAYHFVDQNFSIVSSFQSVHSNCRFDYSDQSKKLITFNSERNNFLSIYDMQSERLIYSHAFEDPIKNLRILNKMDDIIAIANDNFGLYDIRSGQKVQTIDWVANPFDIGYLNKHPSMFALSHMNCTISLVDMRFIEPIKTFKLATQDLLTSSFSTHPDCNSALIGNSHGAYLLDIERMKTTSFTEIADQHYQISNVKSCSFHPYQFRFGLLSNNNTLTTISEETSIAATMKWKDYLCDN